MSRLKTWLKDHDAALSPREVQYFAGVLCWSGGWAGLGWLALGPLGTAAGLVAAGLALMWPAVKG